MSKADLLRRLNVASEIIAAEVAATLADAEDRPNLTPLDRAYLAEYEARTDLAQRYADWLDDQHPLSLDTLWSDRSLARTLESLGLNKDSRESDYASAYQKYLDQSAKNWSSRRFRRLAGGVK